MGSYLQKLNFNFSGTTLLKICKHILKLNIYLYFVIMHITVRFVSRRGGRQKLNLLYATISELN